MDLRNIQDMYPLSPLQQGILFHTLYAPNSRVYCWQLSCVLKNLNAAAFERAWETLLSRHPVLSTSFVWEDLPEPVQVVEKATAAPLERHDWRDLCPAEQQSRFESFLENDRARGFNPAKAPLMRLTLIRKTDDAYFFIWSHHHLLLDGWSGAQVNKEFLILYKQFSKGQEAQLPPLPSYRNYIAWLQRQDLSWAETFWREQLRGFTTPTLLANDSKPQTGTATDADYEEQWLRFPEEQTSWLRILARQNGVTLNTIIQGLWALLISRYQGADDVVFGAVVSGRSIDLIGVESMVGLFINTLPVRVKLPPEAELTTWLKQLQQQQAEMRQFEYTPLIEIQGWSETARNAPLFDSALVFENYPMDEFLAEWDKSLEIEDYRVIERNHYPITLVVGPAAQLKLRLVYDRDRFSPEKIARMLGHLRQMLCKVMTDPHVRLSSLLMLTEEEKESLQVWSHSASTLAPGPGLIPNFEERVGDWPDKIAVTSPEGALSYRRLNQRANQLAHHLRALGVRPETRVGVYLERSIETVVSLIAILKAGGVYLPLDIDSPESRLSLLVEDSQPSVMITQRNFLYDLPAAAAAPNIVFLDADQDAISEYPIDDPIEDASPENLAYIIYTSGSSGIPKGVCVTREAANRHLQAIRQAFRLEPTDRFLQFASLSFDVSIEQILAPLFCGAEVILRGRENWKPSELSRRIREHELNVINLPPAYWRQWIQEMIDEPDEKASKLLRQIIVGGDLVSPESIRKWKRCSMSSTRLLNAYGPTEVTITSTIFDVPPDFDSIDSSLSVPIGRPTAGRICYVVDHWGDMAPLGVDGELQIGGDLLTRGYLNRPALTAEMFRPDPWSEVVGARLYKSGDLARRLSTGDLEFRGRVDRQVKIRGYRIELGEIESALEGAPGVIEAVVIVDENDSDDKRLIAYIASAADSDATTQDLRRYLQGKLPEYMAPASFVFLNAFPMTPSGKIDRKALSSCVSNELLAEEDAAEPQSPVEKALIEMYCDLLGLKRVSIHDNFFDLGGHSLLLTQLASRIRKTFGVDLPLPDLFDNATPNEISILVIARQLELEEDGQVDRLMQDLDHLSSNEISVLLREEQAAL
jgi:surfactin family lipopeptide synthetase C